MPKPDNNKDTNSPFTKIDPNSLPDELKSTYKEMQADYTRKTQEVAELRKQFEAEQQRYEDQLKQFGGLQQEVNHWRQWYSTLSDDSNIDPTMDDPSISEPTDTNKDDPNLKKIAALEKALSDLQAKIDGTESTIQSTADRTNRMFAFHTQLSDLMREHPDLDRDKLVQHAVDNNFTDLQAAFEHLYRDDIINNEVEKRLQERLKEERAKGLSGTGRQVIITPSKDGPKSLGEATQSIINERAASGVLE